MADVPMAPAVARPRSIGGRLNSVPSQARSGASCGVRLLKEQKRTKEKEKKKKKEKGSNLLLANSSNAADTIAKLCVRLHP